MLVGGTMFLMWLGEQITSRGIGNGISLIIMAGIVAHLPTAIISLFEQGRTGAMSPLLLIGIIVVALGLIAFIRFMERAQRQILIQYPKLPTAQGKMPGAKPQRPPKRNTAGVRTPPIPSPHDTI